MRSKRGKTSPHKLKEPPTTEVECEQKHKEPTELKCERRLKDQTELKCEGKTLQEMDSDQLKARVKKLYHDAKPEGSRSSCTLLQKPQLSAASLECVCSTSSELCQDQKVRVLKCQGQINSSAQNKSAARETGCNKNLSKILEIKPSCDDDTDTDREFESLETKSTEISELPLDPGQEKSVCVTESQLDSWSPCYEQKMANWNEDCVTTRQILLHYLQFRLTVAGYDVTQYETLKRLFWELPEEPTESQKTMRSLGRMYETNKDHHYRLTVCTERIDLRSEEYARNKQFWSMMRSLFRIYNSGKTWEIVIMTVIAVVRLCIMAMEVDETLISDMVFLGQQVFFKHYNKWISNKGGWKELVRHLEEIERREEEERETERQQKVIRRVGASLTCLLAMFYITAT